MTDRPRVWVKPTLSFVGATLGMVVVLTLAVLVATLPVWRPLQRSAEDLMQQATASGEPDTRVVIVAIDDRALQGQGKPWPWPRSLLARLLRRIGEGQPRVVGLDLLLDTPAPDAGGDAALADVLAAKVRHVLLEKIVFPTAADKAPMVVPPLPQLRQHAELGYYNLSLDSDGVVRRQRLWQPIAGLRHTSFAQQVVRSSGLRGRGRQPGPPQVLRVSFRRPGSYLQVSADEVLAGRIPAATFRSRIVLVGATFTDAKDEFAVPVQGGGAGQQMHGVQLHANVISNLLDGNYLGELSPKGQRLAVLMLLVLAAAGAMHAGRRRGLVMLVLALVGCGGLFTALYIWGDLALPLVPLLVAAGLGYGLAQGARRSLDRTDRRRPRNLIRVTPPQGQQWPVGFAAQEGTVEQSLTVCLIDIDNFAVVSESLIRRDLGRYLQAYLGGISTIIERHQGLITADPSLGGVALFGLDPRQTDHAVKACRAGLDVIATVRQLEQQWQQEVGVTFQTRVGIHSTQATVARTGATRELTVVGQELNLPMRLTSLSRHHGASVIATTQAVHLLADGFRMEKVGEIQIRERKRSISIYSILGEVGRGATAEHDRQTAA